MSANGLRSFLFICSLCGDENGLRLIVAVVAQICKYTKND